MKCYFCVCQPSDSSTESVYADMLDVALKSGRKNTTLDFVCLFSGDKTSSFLKVLKKYDVKIINHKFSETDCLPKTFPISWAKKVLHKDNLDYLKIAGTLARIDIPFIEKTDPYVLYADVDIMFESDVDELSEIHPRYLSAGPETTRDINLMKYFNSGVMVLNIESMRDISSSILKKVRNGIPTYGSFDQGYLNDECFGKQDLLPLEYNWKPYWGFNPNAKIIHFHGMKPGGNVNISGFAMGNRFFKNVLRGNERDFVGYVIYLHKYFNYLGVDDLSWLNKHCLEVFDSITHYDFIDDSVKPFLRPVKKRIFQLIGR